MFKVIINILASSYFIPCKIRVMLYKKMGIKIDECEIRAKCFLNSKFVSIGKGSFINFFCQFHSSYLPEGYISIGENCFIGMNTVFCAITHEIGKKNKRAGENQYYPINVGNGCWIGANSAIMPNVTIGDGCIIGAGSVVIRDCESNCLYAGNPAKKIKELK